jgi:hypothetical protein
VGMLIGHFQDATIFWLLLLRCEVVLCKFSSSMMLSRYSISKGGGATDVIKGGLLSSTTASLALRAANEGNTEDHCNAASLFITTFED